MITESCPSIQDVAGLGAVLPAEVFRRAFGLTEEEVHEPHMSAVFSSATTMECMAGEYAIAQHERASHILVLLEG
eukprot:CAMPEP_0194536682 /NCGR_PEP_ID=MMETSP0253-20130528/75706_1 /TAXON_ID=2966 /ORGANISM="Noctiluca scintillans" /LENGTH=74 /DNA_ID=CAMNT_0039382633 /DNA_START=1 /DNA_END=222 /DNA_ORIENTATION=+